MSRTNLGLLVMLMARGVLAIGIVFLVESLFFWRTLLVKFGGEEMLSLPAQLRFIGLIFVIFCIFVLPFAFQWAKRGKLNLVRCITLGLAFGAVPGLISVLGPLILDGRFEMTSETAYIFQLTLEFTLPVAGLFWLFGAVIEALMPGVDAYSRGEG